MSLFELKRSVVIEPKANNDFTLSYNASSNPAIDFNLEKEM